MLDNSFNSQYAKWKKFEKNGEWICEKFVMGVGKQSNVLFFLATVTVALTVTRSRNYLKLSLTMALTKLLSNYLVDNQISLSYAYEYKIILS